VGGGFFVDVKSFNGVQVWAFLMELYDLHDVFYGAKGVQMVVQVFGEFSYGCVVAEGPFVFVVPRSEVSSSLANIRLTTIRTG